VSCGCEQWGALSELKKKVSQKSSAKLILSHEEDEESYTHKIIPALVMWYVLMDDHLCSIFENPEDAKRMSRHASSDRMKDDDKLQHPTDA
jgi:hypothetical protein